MTLASVIDQAGDALGGFLPRLAGALFLVLAGILVARLAGRLLARGLRGLGLDSAMDRWGVGDVLASAGLGRSLSGLLGRALRLGITLVVVFASLSLLGLQFLSESLNQAVLFLPDLLVAAGLLLAGAVLGGLARERVERAAWQMDLPIPLGRLAQGAVVAVFALSAATQVAISTTVLAVLACILVAGAVGMLALAFGMGGSDVARELSAGRYLRSTYQPGQRISFGEVRGEIVAVETATTLLRTETGETVRVPNNQVLGSVVTIHT